jgi:lipopolysaccharide export system protein LptA
MKIPACVHSVFSQVVPKTAYLVVVLALCAVRLGGEERFEFAGDKTQVFLGEGRERTVLTGNAWIVSEDTEIRADEIEISGNDFRYARARGRVHATDRKQGIVLTGESLFYDRRAEILRTEGPTTMEDRRNEVIVRGGFLENYGEANLTVIQTGVRILGEDLVARSEFARYRRDVNILELSGVPVVYFKGDEYRAQRIEMNLNTDEITLQGRVRGRITTDQASEENEDGNGTGNREEQ